MAEYITDQEQIEMIKQWWRDYGKFLVMAIVIGLIIGFGLRTWHVHKTQNSLQASNLYQQMLITDAKMDKKNSETIANQLIQNYQNTPYAVIANFLLAKNEVEAEDFKQAIVHLQWVIDHGKIPSFRQMARIRMARILLTEKNSQAAMQVLETVDDASFLPEINSVKGDIYMAMNEKDQAQKAYALAQTQFTANSMEDNILKLKLTQPLLQDHVEAQ